MKEPGAYTVRRRLALPVLLVRPAAPDVDISPLYPTGDRARLVRVRPAEQLADLKEPARRAEIG